MGMDKQEEIEVKWCIMELDSWALPIHLMSQNNESNKQCFFYAFLHHFVVWINFLGFLHFWILLKELLWFGISIQKDFNFLAFLDFFKRIFWFCFFKKKKKKKKKKVLSLIPLL